MYWCAIQIDQSVLVKPGIRYESGVTKVSIENGCVTCYGYFGRCAHQSLLPT